MAKRTGSKLTAEARAYLSELAADIAEHGLTGDMAADIKAAHERRQAFAVEMAEGRTERSQMARKVIAAHIHGRIRADHGHRQALAECAFIAQRGAA